MRKVILPRFLTADFLRDLLNWPRSHERRFIERAAKKPYHDDAPVKVSNWQPDANAFYESLLELLSLPYGGNYLVQTLKSFDNQYTRRSIDGRIVGRLFNAAQNQTVKRPDGTIDICATISALAAADQLELAALIAWGRLHLLTGLPRSLWTSEECSEVLEFASSVDPLKTYLTDFIDSFEQMQAEMGQSFLADAEDSFDFEEQPFAVADQGITWSEARAAIVTALEHASSPDLDIATNVIRLAVTMRRLAEQEAESAESVRLTIQHICDVHIAILEQFELGKTSSPEAEIPSLAFFDGIDFSALSAEQIFTLGECYDEVLVASEALAIALEDRRAAAADLARGAVGAMNKVLAANSNCEGATARVLETVERARNATTSGEAQTDQDAGTTSSELSPTEGSDSEYQPDAPTTAKNEHLEQATPDQTIVDLGTVAAMTPADELPPPMSAATMSPVAEVRPAAPAQVSPAPEPNAVISTFHLGAATAGDPALDELYASAKGVLENLLLERRYGLAHVVAKFWEAISPEMPVLAPCVIFQALSIGTAVQGGTALSAATRFDELKEPLFDILSQDDESASPAHLLAFAAALRPALFSPHASASELVRWGARHESLYSLGKFVADLTNRLGRPLAVTDLAPVLDRQLRTTQAHAATTSLLKWAESAQKQTLKYAPATSIWTSLFKSGLLAVALEHVRSNHKDRISAVQSAMALLRDPERLLERLDNEPRTVMRIEAGAKQRLLSKMSDAAGQLSAWLESQARATEGEPSKHFIDQTAELHKLLRAAKSKIDGELQQEADVGMVCALRVVEQEIGDILRAFEGMSDDRPLSLDQKLNDDILLVDRVPRLTATGFALTAASAADFIAGLGTSALSSWTEAFDRQILARQFEAAARVLERLKIDGESTEDKEVHLVSAYEASLHLLLERSKALRSQVDILLGADAENRIEPSLSNRLEGLTEAIALLPSPAEHPADLSDLFLQCEDLSTEVETAYDVLIDPLRARIRNLSEAGHDVTELESMAARQDLATLAEHIEAVEKGYVLQSVNPIDSLLAEYSSFVSLDVAERSLQEYRKDLEAGKRGGRLDFSMLSDDERQNGAALVNAWAGLRSGMYGEATGTQAREKAILDLFTRLGFTNVRRERTTPFGNGRTYSILCDPLANRDLCPVPAFGSEAKGRYNVVVVEKTATDDLFSVFQKQADPAGANFLVLVGSLTKTKRSQLVQAARRETNGLAAAFVDETVICFLAARAGRRLSDFFDLTIAQGVAQPYSDQATQTSVEMFFGRREELKQLWNPRGSCLVYGGRQLGKTALLKQLQLQYHNPPHHYVLYGSYEEYGDGAKYPTSDFWKRIGELMAEAELAKPKPVSRAQVEGRILEFLNKDPRNRIVILIDEADKILKAEIQEDYRNIAPMKANLMEKTDYRCKFVFAGLHNVQRSARSPNSPLLHFGKAIEVGPLFRSDIQQAWAMVERPLNAVGYYFAERSMIGRVLSLVGYYPSFVQSFCKGLIERLNKKIARKVPDAFLPFVITGQDVDDAARDEAFSGSLQAKFEATLDLDERYRLITYALLIAGFEQRAAGEIVSGYTDVEVQRLALKWWPTGFSEDSSLDAFQGLLDEMVGLGVLVRQVDGKYLIRSARIAAMLGGADAISRKLIELVDKPRPPALDPGHIRRVRDDRVSPLSERQERMLLDNPNPIHLAIGNTALGFEWLAPHVERLSDNLPDDLKFQTFRKIYNNGRDLLKIVEAAAADAQRGNTSRKLSWVIATGPWPDIDMLTKLAEHTNVQLARRGKPNSVRLILVPNGIEWRTFALDAVDGLYGPAALLPLTPLGTSALHFWLAAATSQTPTETDVTELRKYTGGYARYLSNLKGSKPAEIIDSAQRAIDRQNKERNVWQDIGVSDQHLKAAIRETHSLGGIDQELLASAGVDKPQQMIEYLLAMGVLERMQPEGQTDFVLNPLVHYLMDVGAKAS